MRGTSLVAARSGGFSGHDHLLLLLFCKYHSTYGTSAEVYINMIAIWADNYLGLLAFNSTLGWFCGESIGGGSNKKTIFTFDTITVSSIFRDYRFAYVINSRAFRTLEFHVAPIFI